MTLYAFSNAEVQLIDSTLLASFFSLPFPVCNIAESPSKVSVQCSLHRLHLYPHFSFRRMEIIYKSMFGSFFKCPRRVCRASGLLSKWKCVQFYQECQDVSIRHRLVSRLRVVNRSFGTNAIRSQGSRIGFFLGVKQVSY